MRQIAFSPPVIEEEDIQEVMKVLKSSWITTGPVTKSFEKKIADYCGTPQAVCVSSATAAMELVLRVLGIGPGDEVITSAYTYTASASVIAHVGAKPVLVDVVPGSYCMDAKALEKVITDKTKAVIPIDIAGVIYNYEELFKVLEAYKYKFKPNNDIQERFGRIIVVADAAHSFGAVHKGVKSGNIADFSCFSFQAVKNLTTAEGGAITWKQKDILDNDEIYKQLMLYSLQGQSKDALAKTQLGSWEYDILLLGYKYNMTDIAAAVGLSQLERYDKILKQRQALVRYYNTCLKAQKGLEWLIHETDEGCSSFHLYMLRLLNCGEIERNNFIQKMAQCGIPTNVHYKPLPMHTAYRNMGFNIKEYPNSYAMYLNEVTLPLHTLLCKEDIEYIATSVGAVLK
ncbi:MAG: DegT/DnrJ/EryC1/StrS family aminotransferase [Cellulosilyticaceae bacterium]